MTTSLTVTVASKAADKTAKLVTKTTPAKTADGVITTSTTEYVFTENGQTLTISVYDGVSIELTEVDQPS